MLLEQEMMGWRWQQLDYTQIIFTSLQTDNHASTPLLSFYRPDALPAAQPTVSHGKKKLKKYQVKNDSLLQLNELTEQPLCLCRIHVQVEVSIGNKSQQQQQQQHIDRTQAQCV